MIKNKSSSLSVMLSERPLSLSSSTISGLLHKSGHRKPMSMQEHLPGSYFFLQSHDNISITYSKVNKGNILLLFYYTLDLPKENHFVITMHSVLLILIISKH